MGKGRAPMDSLERQEVAEEKRIWVRLTRCCNNRCCFCHDAGCHDGKKLPEDELRRAIEAGAAEGGERLILSGGEPTLHPRFIELVSHGRAQGYLWIQAVSNGRMFAYPGFAQAAVDAGLDEATFSMHGHLAALHDAQVGVEGAFEQSVRGMRQLMELGIVVNVDVVLNGHNIDHLVDIVGFFIGLGVMEFDLLYPVPFGRAWSGRDAIFFPDHKALEMLPRAIERARSSGALVWTNRLPPALLEGHEDLIQDPHKLHDEVRGRRAELEAWIQGGDPLPCREPERCALCPIQGFCDALDAAIRSLREARIPHLKVDAEQLQAGMPPAAWWRDMEVQSLDLHAESLEHARELAALCPFLPGELHLALEQPTTDQAFQPLREGWPAPTRVGGGGAEVVQGLLESGAGPVWIWLDGESAAWMRKHPELVGERAGDICLQLPRLSGLAALCQHGVLPGAALKPLGPQPFQLINLPACLLPGSRTRWEGPALPLVALGTRGRLDLEIFTRSFLCDLHRCFSLRCQDCGIREQCLGLPVDMARAFGLGVLQPFAPGSHSD